MVEKAHRLRRQKSIKPHIIFVFLIILFFMPFLLSPAFLTHKDNDLGRVYVPAFNFIRDSFYTNKSIPLWRNDQLITEPFLSNPAYSLLYPLNLLFLIFPINSGAVFYYLIHFLITALSTYYLAKSFGYSKISSVAAAIFYTFSTKILVHLAGGHITMVAAFSYFPLTFLSLRKIFETGGNFKWVVLCSGSLALMTFAYPTIFYYTFLFLIIYSLYRVYSIQILDRGIKFSFLISFAKFFCLIVFLWFGLSAISLLPQLEFGPISTRSGMRIEDAALPLWNFKRFVLSLFWPYPIFNDLDHEAFLYIGIVPLVLSAIGFWRLKKTQKIFLTVFGVLTLLLVLGLSTPLFKIAHEHFPYLKYSRVTTRVWFIVALIGALLAGSAIEKFKKKGIVYILIFFFLLETSVIGYRKIFAFSDLPFEKEDMYQFLSGDKQDFRVYCTTYCFNPQLLQKYKIQIFNGESPIQITDYTNFAQNAGNYNFSKLAVIFPPYQVWQNDNPPVPHSKLLGLANVKYIVSGYSLNKESFEPVKQFDNLLIYRNLDFKPRAYFKNEYADVFVENSNPNNVKLSFAPSSYYRTVYLSYVYYPGWFAYQNSLKYEVLRQDPVFKKVTILPGTDTIELKYRPVSFELGKLITFSTFLILFLFTVKIKRNEKWQK